MAAILMKELLEKSTTISAQCKNLTSEMMIETQIMIISASLNGCSLILPVKNCTVGHQVLLQLTLDKKTKIEVTGKITLINPIDEKTIEANIVFNQFVKEEWLGLLEKLEKKQDQITATIKQLQQL